MKFHRDFTQFSARKPVVTTGMFDGVHRGHRTILSRTIDVAHKNGGESVVLTFWPHPRLLFEGENTQLRFLTTIEEKVALIKQFGIDHVIVYPFSPEFASMNPRQYVSNILVNNIHATHVVVGYDHRFGNKGAGDFSMLCQLGNEYGFSAEQVPALEVDAVKVSSTKIREALVHGNVELANHYLSYRYSISGTVAKGNQIGGTIGFPTANIEPKEKHKQFPGNGVYIVEVCVENVIYRGVANVGNRPTVVHNQVQPNIEVHLLDFDQDVYQLPITVIFIKKLRDEQKFESLTLLVEKIKDDVIRARDYFSGCNNPG